MKRFSSILFLLVLAMTLAFSMGTANAIIINYQAIDLEDKKAGEDLWRNIYTVTDYAFAKDTGFEIEFEASNYKNIQAHFPHVNDDWYILTFQPNAFVGKYDAFALVDNASLADPFTVDFVWLGSGIPTPQNYDVYDVDPSNILELEETRPVPVPTTGLLLGTGLVVLTVLRKRRLAAK